MNNLVNQELSKKLDQYYTSKTYAASIYEIIKHHIDLDEYDIILEPSAGTGNFFILFDETKRIGIDIDPKYPGIIHMDFFDWQPPENKKIIAIGNPPFGKNSSLAMKFFQKCSLYCDTICFILPKTFRKNSIISKLNINFHLDYDIDVPKNAFIYDEKPYDVPCCFQIWKKNTDKTRKQKRVYTKNDVIEWFVFTTKDNADFCIQRVGANAGSIKTEQLEKYSKASHYFIKCVDLEYVMKIFKLINFDVVKYNTAGNPSISIDELVELWLDAKNND